MSNPYEREMRGNNKQDNQMSTPDNVTPSADTVFKDEKGQGFSMDPGLATKQERTSRVIRTGGGGSPIPAPKSPSRPEEMKNFTDRNTSRPQETRRDIQQENMIRQQQKNQQIRNNIRPSMGGQVVRRDQVIQDHRIKKVKTIHPKDIKNFKYREQYAKPPKETGGLTDHASEKIDFLRPTKYEDTATQFLKGGVYSIVATPIVLAETPKTVGAVIQDPGGVAGQAASEAVKMPAAFAGGVVGSALVGYGAGKVLGKFKKVDTPKPKITPKNEVITRPGVVKHQEMTKITQRVKGQDVLTEADINIQYQFNVNGVPTKTNVMGKAVAVSKTNEKGIITNTKTLGMIEDKMPGSTRAFTADTRTATFNVADDVQISKTTGTRTIHTGQTNIKGNVINDVSTIDDHTLTTLGKTPKNSVQEFTFSEKGDLLKATGEFKKDVSVAASQIDEGIKGNKKVISVSSNEELLKTPISDDVTRTFIRSEGRIIQASEKGFNNKLETTVNRYLEPQLKGNELVNIGDSSKQILGSTKATEQAAKTAVKEGVKAIRNKAETEIIKQASTPLKQTPIKTGSTKPLPVTQAVTLNEVAPQETMFIPTQKINQDQNVITSQQSLIKSQTTISHDNILTNAQDLLKGTKTDITKATDTIKTPVNDTDSLTDSKLNQATKDTRIFINRPKIDTMTNTKQVFQEPISLPKQDINQIKTTNIVKPVRPKIPKDPRLFIYGIKPQKITNRIPRQQNNFDVFVKVGSKWLMRNKKPLKAKDALRLGSTEVLTTKAASFKVTGPGASNIRSNSLTNVFRRPVKRSKLGKGTIFIEKNKFRIDAPKELKQITGKGIQALRKKKRWLRL